jgi:Zn-dependent protease
MALAGPAANLLLVLLAAVLLRAGAAADIFYAPQSVHFGEIASTEAGGLWPGVAHMLGVLFSLNLLLAAFNMLPFPPLDGSGAIPLLLSPSATRRYQAFIWGNPALGWLGFFFAWKLFPFVFEPLFFSALSLLYPGVTYH